MAIEVYHGKYVTAEDVGTIIDLATINECCKTFKTVADKLETISGKIRTLKEVCNKDALSFGSRSMEDIIEQYEKSVKDLSLYLSELAQTIINTTLRVMNRKQTILNEEAIRQDKEKEKEMEQEQQLALTSD